MADLVKAVKELRERLGDTQQAFAARLGLSISAITNYERGRNPTGRSLAQLMLTAQQFGHVDLGKIFRDALSSELGFEAPELENATTFDVLPNEIEAFAGLIIAFRTDYFAAELAIALQALKPAIELYRKTAIDLTLAGGSTERYLETLRAADTKQTLATSLTRLKLLLK